MSEFLNTIQKIMLRDLDKLEQEIKAYKTESNLWLTEGEIKNPAGNLCLHLCGNLQHYIGGNLGKSGYVRNRDAEFSTRNLSREKLLEQIAHTKAAIANTFPLLKEEEMDLDYPENVIGVITSTRYFLIHLTAHLGYHLGQVNYHRRLLDK